MEPEQWLKAAGFVERAEGYWVHPARMTVDRTEMGWVAYVCGGGEYAEHPKDALRSAAERQWAHLRPLVEQVKAAQEVLGR